MIKSAAINCGCGIISYNYNGSSFTTKFKKLVEWEKKEYPEYFGKCSNSDDMSLSINDVIVFADVLSRSAMEVDRPPVTEDDVAKNIGDVIAMYYPQYIKKLEHEKKEEIRELPNHLFYLPNHEEAERKEEKKVDKPKEEKKEDTEEENIPQELKGKEIVTLVQQPAPVVNMETPKDETPKFTPVSIPLEDKDRPISKQVAPNNIREVVLSYTTNIKAPNPPKSPSIGVHKVDNPPKYKPPKANEDKIESSGLDKISFDDFVKKDISQIPSYINKIPKEGSGNQQKPSFVVTPITENGYDNTPIIKKFTRIDLKMIETIGNKNGCHIAFVECPKEIINVIVFENGNPNIWKSFSIDIGKIIDRRIKLITCCPSIDKTRILENAEFYELLTGDRNGAKILDTRMINDIFQAGLTNISKRKMYTEDYKNLNLCVALITIPSRNINNKSRADIQNYLLSLYKAGYFEKARKINPGCRFVFTSDLNPKDIHTFNLASEGVPMFYGGHVYHGTPVIIESKNGAVDVRTAQYFDADGTIEYRYQ